VSPAAYSKNQVRKAGEYLRDFLAGRSGGGTGDVRAEELARALRVVNWWREQHVAPLGGTSAELSYYIGELGLEQVVTQRLQRVMSIADKLHRYPEMKLDRMEDIAGVRAILPTQSDVDALVLKLHRHPGWRNRGVRGYVRAGSPVRSRMAIAAST